MQEDDKNFTDLCIEKTINHYNDVKEKLERDMKLEIAMLKRQGLILGIPADYYRNL